MDRKYYNNDNYRELDYYEDEYDISIEEKLLYRKKRAVKFKIIIIFVVTCLGVTAYSLYKVKVAEEKNNTYKHEVLLLKQQKQLSKNTTSQIEIDSKTIKDDNKGKFDVIVSDKKFYVNSRQELNEEIPGINKWALMEGKVPLKSILVTDIASAKVNILDSEKIILALPKIRLLENGVTLDTTKPVIYKHHPDSSKLEEEPSLFDKIFKADKSLSFNNEDYSTLQNNFIINTIKETESEIKKDILNNNSEIKKVKDIARKDIVNHYKKIGIKSDIEIYFEDEI